MSPTGSPSPIIGTFTRAIEQSFPEDQVAILDSHTESINLTTSKADHQRARHCAIWAIDKAHDKNQSHPRWRQIKELHQLWKDTWFALDFGIADIGTHVAGKAEPVEDARIEWVENAVAVARNIGEEDGWDACGWEQLLVDLVDMEEQT